MEFEEVRNFIEMGHVEGASISATSLHWRHPGSVEPFADPFSRREQDRLIVNTQRRGTLTSKRPNPILGVSRLVNSVRRLKRKNSTNINSTAEVYRQAAQLSPEYTIAQTEVLPELTSDMASTSSPLLLNNKMKKDHISSQPQSPPIASSSIPLLASEVSCNLHKIKWQMQNFVVPTDWYPTGTQTVCLDHENIDSINAQKLIAHLREGIARFEYLLNLEQRKIESSKSDIVKYMNKLKRLDNQTERINATVTYGRLDGVTKMKTLLKQINSSVPQLQALHGQHQRTTTNIEGYNKSMNTVDRLEILQAQAYTTTRTEALWTRVRHWGPFITIITLSMLIALLAVR
ncbi:hypothetical protein INT45_006136 [Circinella minor]|uniref:Uncharacterized protein n=1 Tax=Circinella minor TaxID=1195481 RepID=A0A8H7S5S2_9FUNG|nr:hypothetical protein INT45_006136 [Circinella minor]